jgi:hypothetical protein
MQEGFDLKFKDNELNYLIKHLQNQSHDLLIRYPGDSQLNIVKGFLGEKFVGYCIGHGLWKLGYSLNLKPYPRSYYLIRKYGCDANGHGGVDYLLTLISGNERQYKFLFEVKNWAHYDSISSNLFSNAILKRFTRVDSNKQFSWVVTMNSRNVDIISSLCQRNNIHVLQLSHHITPSYISYSPILLQLFPSLANEKTMLTCMFSSFIDAFCNFITTMAPEEVYPYLVVENMGGIDNTKGIMQDIFMGVSYDVIMFRYGVSKQYIMRLASYIRSFGIPLADRRMKEWRVQWEIQE